MVAAERLIGRLRDDVAVNAAARCLSELALQPFRIQLGSHSVASLTCATVVTVAGSGSSRCLIDPY
jgi:hypothetical protein